VCVLLAVSAVANVAQFTREPRVIERHIAVVPPAPPVVMVDAACPPPTVCPECPQCPEIAVPTHPTGTGTGTAPGRVDRVAAAQGEAHLTAAEGTGERDPVQVAAQRQVADGVDRIVASHSPASAERFLTRNLPALASMDCAFRDPASAEHVRMRLRDINAQARPAARLSDADLTRFERELRCPRE
jgi:hypothetical protein